MDAKDFDLYENIDVDLMYDYDHLPLVEKCEKSIGEVNISKLIKDREVLDIDMYNFCNLLNVLYKNFIIDSISSKICIFKVKNVFGFYISCNIILNDNKSIKCLNNFLMERNYFDIF